MLRLFASFFLLYSFSHADAALVTRQKVLMGTFVSISIDAEHKALISPAFYILKNIDASLSSFNANSPIYKLNHQKSARLNRYSYEALKLSLEYYKETDGYFDIAVGKITKDLYRFGLDERVASQEALKKASTDIHGLLFNKEEAIITDNIKIDLGGMGKGYGVDKLTAFLNSHDVVNAVIALSGDIRCIGACNIAVNNPLRAQGTLASFSMTNSGVSTSGNYNRYVKDVKHNHLINPKNKTSQKNFISVTLISKLPSATLDAYATAVSVMSEAKAYAFLDAKKIAYIILQTDKKLVVSKNIQNYVSHLKFK
jgi:thiamine biosynthesis lipoprotein